MVIAWLPLHRRVSLWVLGKAEARKDDDASTNNSPVWITVASACVRLLLLCITNRVLDCCKFPMPCIPVEHVRHPSIYLHAHSIIFNPSTWHNHGSNTVAIHHVLVLSRVPWKSEWKFPKSELTHNHQHNSPFRIDDVLLLLIPFPSRVIPCFLPPRAGVNGYLAHQSQSQ